MTDPPKRLDAGADAPTLQMSLGAPGSGGHLEHGTVLAGRFEVYQHIGGGGAGVVYAARDQLIGESVAIKLLHERLRESAGQLQRLRAEVRAARRIAHPHVCRVHDLCEAGGLVFVVMERIQGQTLRQYLRAPAPMVRALDIARQLAAGLGAAHRSGVIHCDVKPENAIVEEHREGIRVVLTDFGIARLLRGERRRKLDHRRDESSSFGAIEGTPAYMAPEQVHGRPVDERTDVYGLAAVTYELLFGEPPFGVRPRDSSIVGLLDRILHEPVSFPPSGLVEASAEARAGILDALRRGLAKDPAERPETVEAFIAFLLAAVRLGGGAIGLEHDAILQPTGTLTVASTPTPTPTPTHRTGGSTTPSHGQLGTGPYRGARRITTIVHVRVDAAVTDEAPDSSDEERIADCADALISAAELTLTDAGAVVIGRVPRAIIAAFGAISSRDNEPLRAASAARAIAAAAADNGLVVLRIGCDTGRMLVRRGPRGAPPSVSGAALQGAERLAGEAGHCEVRASQHTARHLATAFELADLGAHAVLVRKRRPAAELGRADRRALMGRDQELTLAVRELTTTPTATTSRAAMVYGGAGIGKSRLASEVEDTLLARGGLACVRIAAQPRDAYTSHAVVRGLLRQMLGVTDDIEPASAYRAARRALAASAAGSTGDEQMIDALAALLVGDALESGVPATAAARAALAAVARRRPLLLLLDDLHWADDASLDLVESLARGDVAAPISLLASTRPELFHRRPQLKTAFRVTIAIQPLATAEALALAESLLGTQEPGLAHRVAESAEGNPFFIEELSQFHLEQGKSSKQTPSTIQEALQARMDRLAPDERDVLRAAALLGREFRAGELSDLLADQADVDQGLRGLVNRQLLFTLPPDSAADDRYMIKHALLRDAAYDELPPAARRGLHRTAAELLQRRADATPSASQLVTIARHLEGADALPEAASAYRRAGQRARDEADVGGAYRCLQRAYELDKPAADLDLLLLAGELAGECGDLEQGENLLLLALAKAKESPTTLAYAPRALRALTVNYRTQLRLDEAVATARRGLTLVDEQTDPCLASQLLGTLGWILGYMQGDNDEGLPLAERAVDLLEQTPHRAQLARACSSLGACYMAAGRWEDQLACNRRHLEIATELGDLQSQAAAQLNLGENLRSMGDLDEAVQHSQRARELYARMEAKTNVGLTTNNVALGLIELGELAGAEREATTALEISRRSGGLYYERETLATLARVHARRGDYAEGLRLLHEAGELVFGSSGAIPEGITRRLLASVYSLSGDHDRAFQELARAQELLEGADAGGLARVHAERWRCLERAGKPLEAAQQLQVARDALATIGAHHDLRVLEDLNYC